MNKVNKGREKPDKLKRKSIRLVNEGLRVRVSYSAKRGGKKLKVKGKVAEWLRREFAKLQY